MAQNAPKEVTGSALTIVNCIGSSITILSIQFTVYQPGGAVAARAIPLTVLAVGPLLGLFALQKPTHANPAKVKT